MKKDKVTPMMAQYNQIKENHRDKVLFFRLGDFYEMFDDDAIEISRLLNLTLTHRGKTPMCGIPYHASKVYIKRLLEAGKKIAICEQVETPSKDIKLVKRDVVQVVTPATVVEDDYLDSKSSNYIICISYSRRITSVAFSDITSGDFILKTFEKDTNFQQLNALLSQIRPKEILVNEDDYFVHTDFSKMLDETNVMITKLQSISFTKKRAYKKLTEHLQLKTLKIFNIEEDYPGVKPAGALLKYIYDTSMSSLNQITSYRIEEDTSFMVIDSSTRKSLEILVNTQDGRSHNTLYSVVNKTITSGGTRLLKKWLSYPLVNKDIILNRQDWVEYFKNNREERDRVRDELKNVLDMVRLTTRISMKRNLPSDLLGIKRTATSFFNIIKDDFIRYETLINTNSNKTVEISNSLIEVKEDTMNDIFSLVDLIQRGINDNIQGPFEEGKIIKEGFDKELDELRDIKNQGSKYLNNYIDSIKEVTNIPNIKLGYNKILGNYIEVRKTHTDKVPSNFYRKQTLVNAERYTSDELSEIETKILKSSYAAEKREREVYNNIVEKAASISNSLLMLANALSRIDVLQSFSLVADLYNYNKPTIVDDNKVEIINGRHPVVEKQLGLGSFVPNDLLLKQDGKRFCLITGPNMAGKSTYLRQCALIILLTQIGSFVPSDSAKISLVDKLFCRVGASDNIAKGESTFMVEMQEAAHILRTASENSFVIMDEIGRGTSTQDGMSLANAFMKHLVNINCKTLFATHYHELTLLDTSNVKLLTLAVDEKGKDITFVRKVIDGVANSSYGLHVAKLAGVPSSILKDADKFQRKHFGEYTIKNNQMDLFSMAQLEELENQDDCEDVSINYKSIVDEIINFDLTRSTPIQALLFLEKLKNEIEENE
ncbi:MAG: DNA mismatch repair protein MutS [Pleomorphochaeta sp.]